MLEDQNIFLEPEVMKENDQFQRHSGLCSQNRFIFDQGLTFSDIRLLRII